MASLNKAIIMGRLGQDPEMRYTQNQIAVCTLNIATSEYKKGQDGQREETTEWHRVVVWKDQAENCGKYLKKGSGVLVEGRLQTRSWEDQQGQKKYTTEIVANNVQFLPSGQQQNQQQGQQQQNNQQGDNSKKPDMGAGFPQNSGFDQGQANNTNNASMDDIPF